jgi:catechol 2,3-dioxygenase
VSDNASVAARFEDKISRSAPRRAIPAQEAHMTAVSPTNPTTSIHPAAQTGLVSLTVSNLERSLTFYTQPIGFELLQRDGGTATLGVSGTPLLLLTEQPGAEPWPREGRSYTGLYHFAILLPTRADLGRWLRHWAALRMPPPGQGDHNVSEALYLEDPDLHGIEVYRDRPREQWTWRDGQVQMTTGPVDIAGAIAEADREGLAWSGLPDGTRIGHVHLQVGDIPEAAAFYHGVLGFDIVARMPSALFVSAGGYHHHLGMNIWHSRGASAAPDNSVRLHFFTIELPTEEALGDVVGRAQAAGLAVAEHPGFVTLDDPWHNTIVLRSGATSDAAQAEATARAVGR